MRLPHAVTVTTPTVGTDAYGTPSGTLDYANGAQRTIRGYVQPASGRAGGGPGEVDDGQTRAVVTHDRVLFTTDRAVTEADRITWEGRTFDVTNVRIFATPRGAHHAEISLREVIG